MHLQQNNLSVNDAHEGLFQVLATTGMGAEHKSAGAPGVAARQCRPQWMLGTLLLTDVASLLLACLVACLFCVVIHGPSPLVVLADFTPLAALVIFVLGASGFYSGISLGGIEELRSSTYACLLAFFIGSVVFLRNGQASQFRALGLAVALALVLIPLSRAALRSRMGEKSWWGYPAVIFTDGDLSPRSLSFLNRDPKMGLKVVAAVQTEARRFPSRLASVPVLSPRELAGLAPELGRYGYALLLGEAAHSPAVAHLLREHKLCFPNLLVIPESWELPCISVKPKNVGGVLGLEMQDQLLDPSKRFAKRCFDLVLTGLFLTCISPLLLLIALAVKLTSRGPIFYGQRRIGRGGREFVAWKFRSMVVDADERLAQCLKDPALLREWQESHKLKNDPRVTLIGNFLRRTSLDEFPQLWNVLKGEMSLVGPRPIVRAEIVKYGDEFGLYSSVHSGVTGLWQVSGRSEISYEQRVSYDAFYVRNWSVWLDMHILVRTIGVLWSRTGAY